MTSRLRGLGSWLGRREPPPADAPPPPVIGGSRPRPPVPAPAEPVSAPEQRRPAAATVVRVPETPTPVAVPTRAVVGSATAEPKPAVRPVVAVTVLGLDGESLETVAALIERQCAERHMQAVCITDQNDFSPFRRRGLIVDQVVDAERRMKDAPELSWRLYRHAQFVLLGKRWRPATVISFGRLPDPDCLKALEQNQG